MNKSVWVYCRPFARPLARAGQTNFRLLSGAAAPCARAMPPPPPRPALGALSHVRRPGTFARADDDERHECVHCDRGGERSHAALRRARARAQTRAGESLESTSRAASAASTSFSSSSLGGIRWTTDDTRSERASVSAHARRSARPLSSSSPSTESRTPRGSVRTVERARHETRLFAYKVRSRRAFGASDRQHLTEPRLRWHSVCVP